MKTKKTKTEKKTETGLVLSKIELAPEARKILFQETPKEFVKQREGRGGKTFNYVEIGYAISQLNTIYGAANWDFDVVDKIRDGDEIVVQGRLTIKDHQHGFSVSKTQFGQCQIKRGQFLGDAFKSATSDCLKKCASLFGIAQDIYWQLLDDTTGQVVEKATITTGQAFQKIKMSVERTNDLNVLREILKKLPKSKLYHLKQKQELEKIINKKLNEAQGGQKTIGV